ncbi:putative tautomerase [Salinisphaera sp. LB1]|nr:putative tautomerase [Salinisphaera sp. LB1]
MGDALSATFDVPENNKFVLVHEHEAGNFHYSADYLGVERSDELVVIQIVANNTRSLQQKKRLYERITALLGENPGVRPEDVFINLIEVPSENWSLGLGLAQYA